MGVVCNECKACLEEATRKPNNNRGQNQNHYGGGGNVGGTTRTGGGSSCYTCTAKINQRPETGRDDFRIQINAQHHGDHTCDQQILTVVFNYPVTFISCSNGRINAANNTAHIQVKLNYHNNQNDNIGMGDFIVKCSKRDLEILECYINDGH